MKYTNLPNTDMNVSKICLGTMTFGEQNTENEAHQQLDYALDQGVNFIDTAEMYAVPGRAETQGKTERFIGSWLKKTHKRTEVIVATKITGPSANMGYIRPNLGFSKEAIHDAIGKSLQRLQTDYIDLYQLHWPERNTNFFGKRGYRHFEEEQWKDNFFEVISTLDALVKEGKIRHYGLSNETPWGVMRHLEESGNNNLTRAKTLQNPYSLLNRTYEVGLAEISMRENIGLLAYSPMAFGILSGKYLHEQKPKNARLTLFPQMSRYLNEQVNFAVTQYAALAKKHGISLAQLALAFVNQQSFVTSNIIGATTLAQLKENIDSIHLQLSDELLKEIDLIHERQPNPAP